MRSRGGGVTRRMRGVAMLAVIGWATALAWGPRPGHAEEAAVVEAEPPEAAPVPDPVPVGMDEPAPGPAALAPEPRPNPGNTIEDAWFASATNLEDHVWKTRRVALERGVWNIDGAARALLAAPGAPLDRAEAAVRLAPDLPAGHMELAEALWLHGESPLSAIRTATGALLAFARHPEGALWLGGSLLYLLALGLICGGALCIAITGVLAAPHAAHDLGDLFTRSLPAFGRAALLLAVLLLASVLGEGPLALVLGLAALGVLYGSNAQRMAIALSAVAIVAGAHPVARLAGAALEALPNDPVARAVLATSRGLALPEDVLRLEAAQDTDLLARQGLARLERRAGNLGKADALYQDLVRQYPEDPVILTNAANVRLHLGHMEAAFDLYEKALQVKRSPVVLYNLSQAYGRAFQVDDLTRALQQAQALDGDLVADLTRLQGTQPEGFVVDLPLSNETLWRRVLDLHGGGRFAAELRAPLAPGRLGATPVAMGAAFGGVIVLAWLVGLKLKASRWCARCGRRVCPRCQPEVTGGELCRSCHRLFYQPEGTARDLRLARIEALRERSRRLDKIAWAASIAVPGAAGVLARRPLRSLIGAVCFAVAVGALVLRDGAVPDPLVAGAAGPFAFFCVAAVSGVAYAIVVATSLAARRSF